MCKNFKRYIRLKYKGYNVRDGVGTRKSHQKRKFAKRIKEASGIKCMKA